MAVLRAAVASQFVGAVCGGLRSSEEEESMGLDAGDHDEKGYVI